jgi:hypothetical protein
MASECLNCSIMSVSVESVTLYDEFMQGYAGVMMGMRWLRSPGFLRASHTRRPSAASSSMSHSITGSGHFQCVYTLKKRERTTLGTPCSSDGKKGANGKGGFSGGGGAHAAG